MLKGICHYELRLTNYSAPVGAHGITEEGQQSDRSVSNPVRQHPIRHGQKYCYSKVRFAVPFKKRIGKSHAFPKLWTHQE